VAVEQDLVEDLVKPNGRFEATLRSGRRVVAGAVVAAPGISRFGVIPDWVERDLSPDRWSHTCNLVHFEELRGKRVLIVGGRQSAFEWAALLADEKAAEVHVVHRHDPPDFAPADWSFVDPLMDLTVGVPGWFRGLPQVEREAVAKRFWAEGRLKLEPWLTPRLTNPPVSRHARLGRGVPGRSRRSPRPAGPFFGFVRGCVPAATLTIEGLIKAQPARSASSS